MNRTGLIIALTIGVVVGVVFGVRPRLDLAASTPFYDPRTHDFPLNAQVWSQYARTAARALITLLIVPAGIALVGKFLFPRRRMLIKAEAVLFLIGTLAVGPGLITNTFLKDHWGRARPIDVTEFGGTSRFTPWWDPRGDCPNNCSFIAGGGHFFTDVVFAGVFMYLVIWAAYGLIYRWRPKRARDKTDKPAE
jgi:membrane-associated PAP2 superfamily phosphatase